LAAVAAALVPLYRIGVILPPTGNRGANFERLWRAMDYAYPYFEEKGIDWHALRDRYYPQAAEAESDGDYWRVVARMLAELNDGHTGLLSPSVRSGRRYFAICRDLNGAIVLDEVGIIGEEAGLAPGDMVLTVDGLPVEQALAELPTMLIAGSTDQHRRAKAAFSVLSTTADAMSVTVTGPAGERTVTLTWPDEASSTPRDKRNTLAAAPIIIGERLPSGAGLIRIPTFEASGDHDLVAEFDAALDPLMDAPGIILDLRGNGGGSTSGANPIAGRFLDDAFTYGREHYPARLPQRGWRARFDYRVKPRAPIYSGPLVLLIDERNFSTAETFIVALVDAGRARAVGRQSGGGSGNPVRFNLTGGATARFSTGDFRRNDGTPIEGVGITPDLPVSWTVEDLWEGRDPDLAAAERLLQRGF
jgi:carboxyl-terminal processing protease